jgi:alkyl sulfatase BDS1-like metallo-beta-lactamase superfamily hydrolase
MNQSPDSSPLTPKDAEPTTVRVNAEVLSRLPFDDRQDFEAARRGHMASLPDGIIRTQRGTEVWNLQAYDFLSQEEAPPTVNPSLWRMARLNMIHGLFKVVDRVYQVRGLDLANMTIIEGDTGLIMIDSMTTAEVARAGLDLYYAYRPKKPIVTVIYSHSHTDHYGGVKGVVSIDQVQAGRVAVIAPDGFMDAVGGESILAGNAMTRRAQFQFGGLLPKGPRGQVDAGLGKVTARGRVSLIAPTMVIVDAVETHTIDGVEMVFQLAPDSEAPAEMHLFLPQFGVLNMAENATRHLHNFCPLRGAVVRDPRMWSHYIAQAIELFGAQSGVLIGQHHWPTWGRERISDFLSKQRDLYKFIHDQSVRLMNHGLRPAEIAETVDLPPELAAEWSVRGYYGTISHNSKAVYQRYLSWYDGNPANLNPLPPRPAARKTIDYMGGTNAIIARAREDFAKGEYRWVAQVMSQVVFAEPDNRQARELAADALEQLGYQAESATWRNAYLYGAQELRHGVAALPPRPPLSPDLLEAVTTSTLFDSMAVRLDPAKVGDRRFVINWQFTDSGEQAVLTLQNSTLTHMMAKRAPDAQASVTMTRAVLVALNLRRMTAALAIEAGDATIEGDGEILAALFDMMDDFEMMFHIVTLDPTETARS